MTITKQFKIPAHLNATEPVEWKKGSRDQVKLMVMKRETGSIIHDQFTNLSNYFKKGDLIVLNNSRTIPSVLKGVLNKKPIEVRLSRKVSEREWEVLLVNQAPIIGQRIKFTNNLTATITEKSYNEPLVMLSFNQTDTELMNTIYKIGEPVRYEYIEKPWPLEAYQTVYGSVPGSVELASAGRAFSWRLLHELKEKGINIAFIQLHAGLSYYENDEWPQPKEHPEPYEIPQQTAELINSTKENGGRVFAIGTTVVRALETAALQGGFVKAEKGTTRLYVTSDHQLKVVDGLLTGFHEPEASHLDMLTAFVEEYKLIQGYNKALDAEYLWHEFGDMNIIIPEDL